MSLGSNHSGGSEARSITLRVRRGPGRYTEHPVELPPAGTLMDALERVSARDADAPGYAHSCHHGSCGTCGVLADGKPVLPCLKPAAEYGERVQLDPLPQFPVIVDLAVDRSPLFANLPTDWDNLRPSEANRDSQPPPELAGGYTRFENCIECGLCEAACPVTVLFRGPAALARLNRIAEKDPEAASDAIAEAGAEGGVWACQRSLQCSFVCPVGVNPAKHIAVLRRKIEKRSGN